LGEVRHSAETGLLADLTRITSVRALAGFSSRPSALFPSMVAPVGTGTDQDSRVDPCTISTLLLLRLRQRTGARLPTMRSRLQEKENAITVECAEIGFSGSIGLCRGLPVELRNSLLRVNWRLCYKNPKSATRQFRQFLRCKTTNSGRFSRVAGRLGPIETYNQRRVARIAHND